MYAVRTGTRVQLDAFWKAERRILVSAAGVHRTEGFRYAIDNGAWTWHQKGLPFDFDAFAKVVSNLGAGADWIACPDKVGDRVVSLRRAEQWLPLLDGIGRARLVVVQDGTTEDDVGPWLGEDVGIFVGGSSEWKDETIGYWGKVGQKYGCLVHVGRVNTLARITRCTAPGITSRDGSGESRFLKHHKRMRRWEAQGSLAL